MPCSHITKRAFADALQQLMEYLPIEKIQVAQICQICGMNRKSFYYHFKDKYDLVDWIFDTGFADFIREKQSNLQEDEALDLIAQICCYFYQNKNFYRKALQIKGQNAFSDHLKDYCRPLLQTRLTSLCKDGADNDLVIDFLVVILIQAITYWLQEKECMPPEQFIVKLKRLVQSSASAIYQETQRQ